MSAFRLAPQLEKDCFVMGSTGNSLLLLLDNARVPWFILVPRVDVYEIYELENSEQLDLLASINAISKFIKDEFSADKLNVAAIGNMVSQLHVHVIGRKEKDYCWPGVVWGAEGAIPYEAAEVARIRELLSRELEGQYQSI